MVAPAFGDLISGAPSRPGIYQFMGTGSQLLYVGKAKDLRSRLRSYLNPDSGGLGARKRRLLAETVAVTWILSASELEAFVLEANLIKRHRPPYNVLLRDDKAYPYLRITIRDRWPRLEVVRRYVRDGSVYFGPYVPAGGLRETLRFIRRTFPIRICKKPLDRPGRPCLQHQMGRCLGPCAGDVKPEVYRKVVDDVRKFLEGRSQELLDELRTRMWHAAEQKEFERAGELRDRIAAIEGAWEHQRVVSSGLRDIDVFGFGEKKGEVAACVLFVRGGRVVGSRDWVRSIPAETLRTEIVGAWVPQFYNRDLNLPDEVVVPEQFDGMKLLAEWLSMRKGRPVRVTVPAKGARASLRRMADDNAFQAFARSGTAGFGQALEDIRLLLALDRVPRSVHCFDISTHGGDGSVGSRISWQDGDFLPADYRRFKIRTVAGMDDFAMMEEVLGRSYRDEEVPDLIVVDGGRGQLESARKGLTKAGRIPGGICAIAKERPGRPERVYLPGRSRAVLLPERNGGTLLLKRVRDEAHRFAVTYQRKRDRKRMVASPLSQIPGIGPLRRAALLRAFGTLAAIRKASVGELAAVPGMNRRVAADLKQALGRGG